MKTAFLTEMGFEGKIPSTHQNMRTEFAWMHALNSDHYFIRDWHKLKGYDYVFIIFPKGGVFLNSVGSKLTDDKNQFSDIFSSSIIEDLKKYNKKICSIQEGPSWFFNDFELNDQFNFYNRLSECDIIFTHNLYDIKWYKGLFPDTQIEIMPTLLIEELIQHIVPKTEDKVIIGGNFSRWYGGFQSYMISDEFYCPKYVQTSHSSRLGEDQIPDLNIIPRVYWFDWMKIISTFKYAVHMMPTIAAGTFSLNCAYFGIPCIGNIDVDTQRICFPDLSFRSEDIYNARLAAKKLYEDKKFYEDVSHQSKINYINHFSKNQYLSHLKKIFSN
jgi:hypothetical protein